VGVQIPPHKTGSDNPTKVREVRAKAAGTNAAYIAEADRLLKEEPEVFAQVAGRRKAIESTRELRTLTQVSSQQSNRTPVDRQGSESGSTLYEEFRRGKFCIRSSDTVSSGQRIGDRCGGIGAALSNYRRKLRLRLAQSL
jgi:hypothetical protein